jgi:hypothetical protein
LERDQRLVRQVSFRLVLAVVFFEILIQLAN